MSKLYTTSHVNALFVGPLVLGNLIAGNPHVIFPSYGGFTVYFPYALTEGAIIDQDSLDFQNPGYQTLAYRYKGENSTYFPNGGHWYPEVFDHYLGLYFKDTADCYHYGWVRLDVKDSGREWANCRANHIHHGCRYCNSNSGYYCERHGIKKFSFGWYHWSNYHPARCYRRFCAISKIT